MGTGFSSTWLRQVSPLLHVTTLTIGAAVNNFTSTGYSNLSKLDHPFNDCNAINKFFADIASDPTYNHENDMSFIHECDNEHTTYFEQFHVYRLLTSIVD